MANRGADMATWWQPCGHTGDNTATSWQPCVHIGDEQHGTLRLLAIYGTTDGRHGRLECEEMNSPS
ncbi:hypothetical protein E2562_038111 [Oryza meyeriana var. granulata]|uniref:Uncharacterized protein n=1 Tax=Oryza meyeriana var. granulata TaxID=110450 RepID=A0A6G1EDP5_9ORYZ|nr:hypothetical protein E2562_038111 [Oryza meyeriana var. granulata]